ncbi:MAG: pilus assembly protein TadG-related protein [Nitrospirales bacterium]
MNRARLLQKVRHALCRQPLTKDTRGAVAVTVAIMLVVLLSFGALALDISNATIARNELQNVADAAALAGARQLGVIYAALPTGTPYTTYTYSSPGVVEAAVTGVASANPARELASISINPGDIVIGVWNSAPRTLTPGTVGATGVQVTARRDAGANGPVATWLAGVMGINSMSVVATATAALTGTGILLPGEANAPFGLDELIFNNPAYCGMPIQFYPTNNPPSGCAGWQTFDQSPPNANTGRNIVQGLTPNPPTYTAPQIQAGQTSLEYIGGNVASVFPSLINLYKAKRVPDASSPSGFCWNVTIPVYANNNCANPNTAMLTIGFASACVWNVQGVPTQQIDARVTCGEVTNGGGGGGSFGTLGSIPGLVK